jgi:transcriptional regulator GlxA family with amidase domain
MEFHYPSNEIGIVLYPDFAFAAAHGLTDMVTVARTVASETGFDPIADIGNVYVQFSPTRMDCGNSQ